MELYYHSETCRDEITFKRETQSGHIHFHRWGFDISFQTKGNTYGGVLVRSLIDKNKYKAGNKLIRLVVDYYGNEKNKDGKTQFSLKSEKISGEKNICLYRGRREIGKDNIPDDIKKEWAYVRNDVYDRLDRDQKNRFFTKECI